MKIGLLFFGILLIVLKLLLHCASNDKRGRLLIIVIIITDIHRGSSTHAKVVFREVLHSIELEFGNVDF